ncbi:MAG: enoyl-CoA hydratase/isomerase family protein [Longimicrobiales bacterium]|nr:enoyl-CoA hydratase/isomerase family protein [Longimicrobiales bacterium]
MNPTSDPDSKPASQGVVCRRDGSVTRIVLTRPRRHNALGADDVVHLKALLDDLAQDDGVRAVIVTGEGETFCSGASLPEMESGRMSGALFDTLTEKLATLPLPTIARLNGPVYGGGAELALCCDFRVGTPGLRLSVPAARLGVCYPPGGLGRYVSRLGLGTASRILLAGEELDADELLRTGYLTHLVPDDGLDARVDALSKQLGRLAPLAVRNMKRILLHLAAGGGSDGLAARLDPATLAELVQECADSRDLKEGLEAWREGREPDFRGR